MLWLPLSVWPPLARRLKVEQQHGRHSWYLLEVPCLKFYACFVVDFLFFVSLTFLAQGPDYLETAVHAKIADKIGLRGLIIVHTFWAMSIAYSDWERHFSSKWAEINDLKEEFVRMWLSGFSREAATSGVRSIVSLTAMIMKIDQLVDVCDLFGPLLALIVLFDWLAELEDDGGRSVPMPSSLSYSLLLFGWRMLRVMAMLPSMGPLILTVNSMLGDVARWLLVQLILVSGYTAAFYALFGSPDADGSTRFVGWEENACETVRIGENQVLDGHFPTAATPSGTLILTFWRVAEQFLSEEADMECVRQYSREPVATSILMMSFQAISAIMMINMLIAMMAKTFDDITTESAVNFTYLRSRVVLEWVERHPSPPPFTLITLASRVVAAAFAPCRLICAHFRQKGRRGGDTGAEEGGRESYVNGSSTADVAELDRTSSLASTSSLGVVPDSPDAKMGVASEKKFIVLMADHSDEQHVRNTSKLLADYITLHSKESPPQWGEELQEQVRQLERATKEILEGQANLAKEVRESLARVAATKNNPSEDGAARGAATGGKSAAAPAAAPATESRARGSSASGSP